MIQGIDHLVIVVNDLEQATRDYQELGFNVVPGGRHPVGSHNALIAFADGSYLEILAFYREAPDHRWWEALIKGEGLVDFCFQTDDLRGDTKKLRDAGVAINDPVPWARKRPDGYELKWLLSLATGSHRGVAPFLIEDLTPRSDRVPQDFTHANQITGIEKVTIAVNELESISKWYGSLSGTNAAVISAPDLNAEGLGFHVGPHVFEFLAPREPISPLVNWLRRFGPSPYSAVLKGASSALRPLDPRLTHGARLFVK
jgi:catechol 2,3-dioxygenase-like lactoylglutathione lyase family enzyme